MPAQPHRAFLCVTKCRRPRLGGLWNTHILSTTEGVQIPRLLSARSRLGITRMQITTSD